jgi:hypothetical protein
MATAPGSRRVLWELLGGSAVLGLCVMAGLYLWIRRGF